MNTTFLQTFIAIVETRSLVNASARLNVTQSTVTARLKRLEEELGQVLLDRHKSGVTLTPAGTRLLGYARIMTGLWRQAVLEAGLPAGVDAICNFGCTPDLWETVGRRMLALIRHERPEIAMSVFQGSTGELETWMASGQIDLCFTSAPMARKTHSVIDLPPEQITLYSDRRDTSLKSDPQYLFVDHGEEYRRWHGESYFDAGTARLTFNTSLAALEFMLGTGGSAYLPRSLVAAHPARAQVFEMTAAPVFPRDRFIVVSKARLITWDWFDSIVDKLRARVMAAE